MVQPKEMVIKGRIHGGSDIVGRLALKDPQCFETLVDRYSRYIAAVVAKVAGGRFNSYDVEEITGDVLVKLWTDGPKIICAEIASSLIWP